MRNGKEKPTTNASAEFRNNPSKQNANRATPAMLKQPNRWQSFPHNARFDNAPNNLTHALPHPPTVVRLIRNLRN